MLRRSSSFSSLSSEDFPDGANDSSNFQSGLRFYSSFGKTRERKLPHRYYGCRRKEGPVKEGFLWVQQSPGHFNKSWKLRYALLFSEKLCYMKPKQASDDISGSLDYTVIKFSDIVSVKVNNELHEVSESETFVIKTTNNKTLFRCRNQEDRDEWMVSLLTAKSSSMIKEAIAKKESWEREKEKERKFAVKCWPPFQSVRLINNRSPMQIYIVLAAACLAELSYNDRAQSNGNRKYLLAFDSFVWIIMIPVEWRDRNQDIFTLDENNKTQSYIVMKYLHNKLISMSLPTGFTLFILSVWKKCLF